MIAYAGEDGLGLPERAYYLEDRADYVKIRGEYVAHIEKTLTLAGVKPEEAKQDAQWIMALETRDAKASLSPIEARDPKNQYHYVSVTDADKATPHFSWTKFLAAQGLSGVQGFSLSQPEWFAEFDKMLTEVPIAQWKAYLRFHAIDEAAPYLSHAFVEEHFDFNQHKLRGQKEIEPRWKRTLNAVNGHLGQAMGQLYVKENFPPAAKQSAEQLVGNLQAALKIRIEKLDWMSAETKTKALEKLSTFRPKIGYPDKWRDWTGLTITRAGYLDNVLAASKFNHDWRMGRIGKPVDKTEWGMTPQTVNASYSPLKNEITFPAAILQPPYFDAKADDALNYGGIARNSPNAPTNSSPSSTATSRWKTFTSKASSPSAKTLPTSAASTSPMTRCRSRWRRTPTRPSRRSTVSPRTSAFSSISRVCGAPTRCRRQPRSISTPIRMRRASSARSPRRRTCPRSRRRSRARAAARWCATATSR